MSKLNKLNADRQTLSELEIYRDDTTGMNIFDLLDRTVTSGGKDNLKILFQNPFNTASDILEVQDVLKVICKDVEKWKIPFTKKMMDLVEVYYFSKSDTVVSENPVGRFIEGLFYRIKYKDYKETALQGTKSTLFFLVEMKKYFDRIKQNQLPTILQQMFSTVEQIMNDKDIQSACSVENIQSLGFIDSITIDQWFRSTHKRKISTLIDIAYRLDVYLSMAKAVNELHLVFPEIIDTESPLLEIEGLFHLFLKNPISNDLTYDKDKHFLFLTGPNMAGKTTFLKSCGIAIYLAQLGMGVPAKRMKISPFNALFSSLNTTDNLSIGYSYFYSEVMRVRKAAETIQKEKKVFMIFDELFKGTNIKDAFDGSMLVINGLLKWDSGMFILASHLTELSKKIDDKPSVFFKYFDSSVDNGRPVFSYKICDGKSDERLGLIILQNEKIEELLTPS
jgi:DNA mismatch repair protein MutS